MRSFAPLVLFALFVGLASAAPVPKSLHKKKVDDKAALVGIWQAAPGARDENFEFTADGKMRAWTGKGGPGATAYGYTWTIDPTTDPKQMTWKDQAGRNVSFECVYELDGDRLRIGYSAPGQRPTGVLAGQASFICDLARDTSAR